MTEPTIIICFADISRREIDEQDCPTCKSKQDFYCTFEEWYGWTVTCLNCGDQWMDGERLARPFARGWRKDNIEYVKEQIERYSVKRAEK